MHIPLAFLLALEKAMVSVNDMANHGTDVSAVELSLTFERATALWHSLKVLCIRHVSQLIRMSLTADSQLPSLINNHNQPPKQYFKPSR